ncbi:hybrid sensor histidine kinase/response regulator [Nitrincola sp. MINF-07-Sa-05]|uniref:hybrid sensor histidine kinase/response regulator n=1 Tax=Nitrincola salilacus TaxID=3400273 RepID=UPI0039184332
MADSRQQLQQRLLKAFQQEAEERLHLLDDGLAQLAQGSITAELLEVLYREVHSLKGAARAVSLADVEQLCQALESLFAQFRKGEAEPDTEQIQLSLQALRWLQKRLDSKSEAAPAIPPDQALAELCRALEQAARHQMPASQAAASQTTASQAAESQQEVSAQQAPAESLESRESPESCQVEPLSADMIRPVGQAAPGRLRVSAEALDQLWLYAETLLETRLESAEHARVLQHSAREFANWRIRQRPQLSAALRSLQEIRTGSDMVDASRLEHLHETLSVLGTRIVEFFDQWEYRLLAQARQADQLAHRTEGLAVELRQDLQRILLLPCATLVEGVPAMVRDLAAAAGKQVNLTVSGTDYQVDKRILDEVRSPLQHLLRNAIDHGIETPQQRLKQGKPEQGSLQIQFSQTRSDRITLTVADDGAGLQTDRLRAKALAQGVINAEQAETLDETDSQRLIFRSGLSTSAMLTELSGRGLGLAIVEEKVLRLNGKVEVFSEPEQGCRFVLTLPVSLATYRALLVRVAQRLFAIPSQTVQRVLRVPLSSLGSIENRVSLVLEGQALPLWRLSELLQLQDAAPMEQEVQLVLLEAADGPYALQVDEILNDQEITLKSLGPQLKRVPNVTGAASLGDGQLVPVLDMLDIYQSACRTETTTLRWQQQKPAQRHRLLVVEDSITARSLLKSILESSGYEVQVAVDGEEAWQVLQQGRFDGVVSDIEMPRLDGFDLTARIRADAVLTDLPVVLVTALQSPEDRERGLEVGASAYIQKSGFDQDHLLDLLKRLLIQGSSADEALSESENTP